MHATHTGGESASHEWRVRSVLAAEALSLVSRQLHLKGSDSEHTARSKGGLSSGCSPLSTLGGVTCPLTTPLSFLLARDGVAVPCDSHCSRMPPLLMLPRLAGAATSIGSGDVAAAAAGVVMCIFCISTDETAESSLQQQLEHEQVLYF